MFLFGHDVFLFDISMFRFGNDKFLLGSNMFRLRHDVFPLVYYLFISSIAASGAMFLPLYEFKPQIIPRELFWFETTRFCLGPFLKAMAPNKKAKTRQSKDLPTSSAEIDRSSNAVLAEEWQAWRSSNPVRSIVPMVLEHFDFARPKDKEEQHQWGIYKNDYQTWWLPPFSVPATQTQSMTGAPKRNYHFPWETYNCQIETHHFQTETYNVPAETYYFTTDTMSFRSRNI